MVHLVNFDRGICLPAYIMRIACCVKMDSITKRPFSATTLTKKHKQLDTHTHSKSNVINVNSLFVNIRESIDMMFSFVIQKDKCK